MTTRIALVTGASSGIGAGIAERLAADGFVTYAAARRMEKMAELTNKGVKLVELDITDEASIAACVKKIESDSGQVDVLVNNAGYGSYGSVEEVPLAEARHQFEVNLFGLAALTQRVIPHMRERRWGRIINISSVGGVSTAPFGAWYHSSKFALEGLSAALRQELEPFGVDVVIIRPGAIRSEWAGIAMDSLEKTSGHGPYSAAVAATVAALKKFTGNGHLTGTPADIAEVVSQAATRQKPRTVYVAPLVAKAVPVLRWLLSDRAMDALVRKSFALPKKVN